jgi:hypothetical protein
MSDEFLGWVVVEWNQASHQPSIDHGMCLSDDLQWAHELARMQQESARSRGRGERYTVHAVMAEEIEETQ